MSQIKRLTTAQVANICGRGQRTIIRWVHEEMFSDVLRVQDGYLFLSSATVSCFEKIKDGESIPMTLAEIAADAEIEI